MAVRLGDAICVAAITFACSSYSVSSIGIEKEIIPRPVASGRGIVGVASSYNPYRKDNRSGGIETASGERYDPTTLAAAIHISGHLRAGCHRVDIQPT
jgi:rare lipoprotein A